MREVFARSERDFGTQSFQFPVVPAGEDFEVATLVHALVEWGRVRAVNDERRVASQRGKPAHRAVPAGFSTRAVRRDGDVPGRKLPMLAFRARPETYARMGAR